MADKVNIVLTDRWIRWLNIAALILNGSLWLVIWRWFPHTEGSGPLHYTIYFGINLTGPWTGLFALPGLGLLAIFSHLIIGRFIGQVTWARLWSLLSVIINVLAGIALAAVFYLAKVNGL